MPFWSDITFLLMLLALLVLVVVSAFFSGSETALFNLSAIQRKQITQKNSLASQAIKTLLSETRTLLITLLMGNMTVNVLYFAISSVAIIHLKNTHSLNAWTTSAFSLVPLIVVILLGEMLPKLVATSKTVDCANLVAVPLLLVHRTIGPIRSTINFIIITPLARLLTPTQTPDKLTPQELESLLNLSHERGLIDQSEGALLQQVLALGSIKVRDLMVPRVDIRAFNLSDEPEKLLTLAKETHRGRLPVYRGDLDQIQGIIYTRQLLLRTPTTSPEIEKLVCNIMFVPELQRADKLLMQFRKSGATLAIAVDEYGGTAGLVTLKDVVQKILGPILSIQNTSREPQAQQIAPNAWKVSGDLSIHDWRELFGPFGTRTDLTTVAGLVMTKLGRIPTVGEQTTLGNIQIQVHEMDGSRIQTLIIRLIDLGENS